MLGARRIPQAAAGAITAVLLALAPRYGWHRDELYFLQCGRRLAWGYVDQPPLVPLLARIADEAFAASLLGLRAFPAVAIGLVVLLAAAVARELGGSQRAQAIAALVTATTPLFAGMGHLLSTATIDLLFWTAILWLVVRLVRTGDVRLWLPVGALFGLGMLNKHSVAFLAGGLAVGLLATPARALLRSAWAVAGAVVALVMVAPNVVWHATREWPVVDMMRSLSAESGVEDHVLFVPAQLAQAGPAVVLWLPALFWLFRGRYRALTIAYLALVVFFVVTAGKPYYLAGAYPALIAAGAARWDNRGFRTTGPALIAFGGAVFSLVLALPLAPVGWQRNHPIDDLQYEMGAQLGWEEMVAVIAEQVAGLPATERASVAILTANYGQAGAVDLYGPDRGLPPAASVHNNYWWWGPPDETEVTIVVGVTGAALDRLGFARCTRVHTFAAPHGVLSEESGTALHLCRAHERPWRDSWDGVRVHAA